MVKDVMTTRVIWVRKDASFKELAAALRAQRVSAFPVLDEAGRLVGIVSEADLLAKEAALDGEPGSWPPCCITGSRRRLAGSPAADLMTSLPGDRRARRSVAHAAKLMSAHKVKRLPVVDANGHLVGIISRADVLAVFDRSDLDIRKEITDVMRNEFLVGPKEFKLTIKDGVVTLSRRGARPLNSVTTSCSGSGTSRAWWLCVTAWPTRRPIGRMPRSWPAPAIPCADGPGKTEVMPGPAAPHRIRSTHDACSPTWIVR